MNYITSDNLRGRLGHRLGQWATPFLLSKKTELDYVYKTFTEYPIPFLPISPDKIETFFSLGISELKLNDIKIQKIIKVPNFTDYVIKNNKKITDFSFFYDFISKYKNENNILFELTDQSLYSYWDIEVGFKEKYKKARELNPILNNNIEGYINIAVHLRRGDVTKQEYPNRYTENSFYINILKKITEHIGKEKIKIHIYSEGLTSDFSDFNVFDNVIFHINENVLITFHSMVESDILITSKSGFSYFASIFSNAKIIVVPFWSHYPENNRVTLIDENGNFNMEILKII